MASPTAPPLDHGDKPEDIIRAVARAQGVDPDFALSIAQTESGLNPKIGASKAGAIGLMQLMPETAARHKVNPNDLYDNILGGVMELRDLYDANQGDPELMARRYNGSLRAAPNLTDDYAIKVLGEYEKRKGFAPGTLTAHVQRSQPQTPTAPPTAPPQTTATIANAVGTAPPPPTLWERWTGHRSELPPDVAAQYATLHQHDDTGSLRDIAKTSQLSTVPIAAARAYDPRERQGRRNIAGTVGAIAAAPAIAAAAPAALAGSVLVPIAASALASGAGGVLEEGGEQAVEAYRGQRSAPDLGAIASAGGQQAAQDVLGHAALAPVRFGLRASLGPGVAREVATTMGAERERLGTFFQNSIDSLSQAARDLRYTFAGDKAARTVASESAVEAARRQAADALAAGKATTARGVGVAEDVAARDVAATTAQRDAATQAAGTHYEQAIGAPPSETAAGQRVVQTLEGPAKDEVTALGQALEQVKQQGPVQDISAIQNEARRLVQEEILPPARAFPREAPTAPPAPGAPPPPPVPTGLLDASGQPITRPAPPPPPPAGAGIDPQLGIAITDAERDAIARHPAMATINRLVNANRQVSFKDLADLETELGANADFTSPVANKVEGARKHLWQLIRDQLGTHEPYDTAATAYAEGRARLSQGYGAAATKIGDIEPARIIQSISPDDPLQTATLMRNLNTHSPEAARAVQDTWLYRNVLQGGLDGLSDRLQVLRDKPEFARALFGTRLPDTLSHYEQLATGWQQLQAAGTDAIARTEAQGAEGLSAAQALGAQRTGEITAAGRAGVKLAQQQGKGADRAAAATQRDAVKQVQDQLAAAGISKRAASTVTEQEALAIKNAQGRAQQIGNMIFAGTVPHSGRGTMGLLRLLTGPSSADLLQIAAQRPEVSQALVDWMANPNARISYQVVKRLLGQQIEQHAAGPAYDKARAAISQAPPTLGGTPLITASAPPAPPPRTEINATITGAPSSQREAR